MKRSVGRKRLLSLAMIILGIVLFFGCSDNTGGKAHQRKKPIMIENNAEVNSAEESIQPIPLPEGAVLDSLYLHEVSMSLGPHYLIKRTEEGTFFKFTRENPLDAFEEQDLQSEEDPIFSGMMEIRDSERASLVKLSPEIIAEIEELIVTNGVLSWHGFNKSGEASMELDSGESFVFQLGLSDGTKVEASGYNAFPDNYGTFQSGLLQLLEDQVDYSHYQAKNFSDSPPKSLLVEFDTMYSQWQYYKLELDTGRNQWVIVLLDQQGELLPKGTEISEYERIEGNLALEPFMEILKKHGFEPLNGHKEDIAITDESIRIGITFENGKEYFYLGKIEGRESFREEFIEEILKYYEELKR